MHGAAGTDMTGAHGPLQTPFDRKKAAAIGLRKWVRFAKDGETTIMQVIGPTHLNAPPASLLGYLQGCKNIECLLAFLF